MCSNPNCGGKKGHTLQECMAFGGGNQGKYAAWWRGPWNIHLPPDQHCRANNIPPTSHPAYKKPATASKPTVYYTVDQPDSSSRASISPDLTTTDDQITINSVTTAETPAYDWNGELDSETIVASLPILEQTITRNDTCHHDSGASRHVFHDRTAFETYTSIEPLCIKGFGRDLSTVAIGSGTVRVQGRHGTKTCTIILHNVLHVPAARSNLLSGPLLDRAGVSSLLRDGLATLSFKGTDIIGGALHKNMYRLNLSIIRPPQPSLAERLQNPPLISRLSPLAAAASSDQTGFYTA